MRDVAKVILAGGGIVLWEDAIEDLRAATGLDKSGAELLLTRAVREGEVEMKLHGFSWRPIWALEAR